MSKDGPTILAAVMLFAAAHVQAQEALGFGELRLQLFPGATGKQWQLVERVRPTLSSSLSERVTLIATVEAGLVQGRDTGEEVAALSGLPTPSHRNELLRIDGEGDYLYVDRLHVDYYGEGFDLRVGRQVLNWGSAQYFNPTDPFPEVLLAEPWRPRRAVNAARLNLPLSEALDLSSIAAMDGALKEFRGAARLRLNLGGTDLALVGAYRGENTNSLVGVDLRGTFGVGWWLEAAYLFGRDPHEQVSVGVDYSFPILERAVVMAQYYRNGAGSKVVTPALRFGAQLAGGEPDPFAASVLGRDYGLVGATLGLLPELSASAFTLQNLNDGSGAGIVTTSWSALDWLELAASAQLPYQLWGSGGELRPRKEDLHFNGVDFSGLVPDATVTVWSRASF